MLINEVTRAALIVGGLYFLLDMLGYIRMLKESKGFQELCAITLTVHLALSFVCVLQNKEYLIKISKTSLFPLVVLVAIYLGLIATLISTVKRIIKED